LALQRAKDLGAEWPKLGTSKQLEFIRAVVKTVILGRNNLWIEVDQSKILATLVGHDPGERRAENDREGVVITLKVEFQPIRRGVELRIDAPNGQSTQAGPIPSLVKEIARARAWYEQLVSGEVSGVERLAQLSGFKRRYVRKILQSAVLSPEIIEAILSGRQSRRVTMKSLQADLPLDWRKQEQIFLPEPSSDL
jgi:hypothetical protein